MSLKDTWTPQTETMDASPDIPNMLADAIIQNESDIVKVQSTADSANKTAAAVSEQLGDMNVAIQANTDGILNTNIGVSKLTERVVQNEADIKELQESGGSGESEIFYVNVTRTTDTLTSDKTFDETYEAAQSGKEVVAIYDSHRFALAKIEPAILWFSSSFSTGDWNGKMRTLMCIKNSDADVWGDHEINLAGTAYVDDAVVEAKPLIVTITGSDIDGYRGNYNYNDVQAAYQAGRYILVKFQGEIYHLRGLNGDVFEFNNLGRDSLNKGVLKMFGCMPLGWMAASDIELASTTYIKQYVEDAILGGAW